MQRRQGGDLWKLNYEDIQFLLLINISKDGLKEAQHRFNNKKIMEFKPLAGNFETNMISIIINKLPNNISTNDNKLLNLIVIHFAFHYFLTTFNNILKIFIYFLKE